jgi:hypothetical protein
LQALQLAARTFAPELASEGFGKDLAAIAIRKHIASGEQ